MNQAVTLKVTLRLLSDAIFGSGESVPGGEDIGVARDRDGYPILKGSSFKGLLREALENYLAWTGGDEQTLRVLLGESGWSAEIDPRQLHMTALTLADRPAEPEDCCSYRTFTAVENGTVRDGTLRTALVINSGASFIGELTCFWEDVPLVLNALRCIKQVGTLKSRGFGRVKVTGEALPQPAAARTAPQGGCLRLRIRNLSPVIITDLQASSGNNADARGYISGSAVRGAVISALAKTDPDWFAAHRTDLLSERTRFLDLMPIRGGGAPLPTIKGFYEDKKSEDAPDKEFTNIVVTGGLDQSKALKRASLGSFCAVEGDVIRYWSAESSRNLRIMRKSKEKDEASKGLFHTVSLAEGQEFEGYILTEIPGAAERIAAALGSVVWLGADRYAGFGKCEVSELASVPRPRWIDAYGAGAAQPDGTLYLLAVSPFSMTSANGDLCGIDEAALAAQLGVDNVKTEICATSIAEFSLYNRTWGCRDASVVMYDRGSLFKLVCSSAPARDALARIEREGLGVHRAEGFGQVLFLRPALLAGIKRKKAIHVGAKKTAQNAAALRRAKYRWIMDHTGNINCGNGWNQISKSQLGEIQRLCEQAIAAGGDTTALWAHLQHNREERREKHGSRFDQIIAFIRDVLDKPLAQTLGVKCVDSDVEKLRLLCMLFDFSRKEATR